MFARSSPPAVAGPGCEGLQPVSGAVLQLLPGCPELLPSAAICRLESSGVQCVLQALRSPGQVAAVQNGSSASCVLVPGSVPI